MEVWKIIFLSKWVIFRFHVNLPGFGGIKERKSMANRHLEVRESSLEISLKNLPEEDLTCFHAFTNCVHCFLFWGKMGNILKSMDSPYPKICPQSVFSPKCLCFFLFQTQNPHPFEGVGPWWILHGGFSPSFAFPCRMLWEGRLENEVVTKSFRCLKNGGILHLIAGYFEGGSFLPYISRIHTACTGRGFLILGTVPKCLVKLGPFLLLKPGSIDGGTNIAHGDSRLPHRETGRKR